MHNFFNGEFHIIQPLNQLICDIMYNLSNEMNLMVVHCQYKQFYADSQNELLII